MSVMTLLFESCIYSDDETIQSVDRPRTGPQGGNAPWWFMCCWFRPV